jgi:hypothetical protein
MYVTSNRPTAQPATEVREPIFDDPFLEEIFATGMAGVANMGGVIVVTLECARCDHTREMPAVERAIVGRIALTIPAAQQMVANLNAYLEHHGLSPTRAVSGAATFQ